MMRQWINWRTGLTVLAVIIIAGSAIYSHYLSHLLETSEKKKVEIWVSAQKTLLEETNPANLGLALSISASNLDIPIIETDEHNHITGNYRNLDSSLAANDSNYLRKKLKRFQQLHAPIRLRLQDKPLLENKYYYGESMLQRQLRYFPLVELLVVILFLTLLVIAQRNRYRSHQNLLWVGMAKETAHQLGTPITSLEGWSELLKAQPGTEMIAPEMGKDINRLRLISDRFSKIGSPPKLEKQDIIPGIQNMVSYMQKRAAGKISIQLHAPQTPLFANISVPLFDWVIENLLKNALDAMEGKGSITVHISTKNHQILIDVQDTGKGISPAAYKQVFNPGFTTKKRGWGLGLALTKRIVEEYHQGHIIVHWSELGRGTTFRIILPKG